MPMSTRPIARLPTHAPQKPPQKRPVLAFLLLLVIPTLALVVASSLLLCQHLHSHEHTLQPMRRLAALPCLASEHTQGAIIGIDSEGSADRLAAAQTSEDDGQQLTSQGNAIRFYVHPLPRLALGLNPATLRTYELHALANPLGALINGSDISLRQTRVNSAEDYFWGQLLMSPLRTHNKHQADIIYLPCPTTLFSYALQQGNNSTLAEVMVDYVESAVADLAPGPGAPALLLGCIRPPREYPGLLSEVVPVLENRILIVLVGSSVGERNFAPQANMVLVPYPGTRHSHPGLPHPLRWLDAEAQQQAEQSVQEEGAGEIAQAEPVTLPAGDLSNTTDSATAAGRLAVADQTDAPESLEDMKSLLRGGGRAFSAGNQPSSTTSQDESAPQESQHSSMHNVAEAASVLHAHEINVTQPSNVGLAAQRQERLDGLPANLEQRGTASAQEQGSDALSDAGQQAGRVLRQRQLLDKVAAAADAASGLGLEVVQDDIGGPAVGSDEGHLQEDSVTSADGGTSDGSAQRRQVGGLTSTTTTTLPEAVAAVATLPAGVPALDHIEDMGNSSVAEQKVPSMKAIPALLEQDEDYVPCSGVSCGDPFAELPPLGQQQQQPLVGSKRGPAKTAVGVNSGTINGSVAELPWVPPLLVSATWWYPFTRLQQALHEDCDARPSLCTYTAWDKGHAARNAAAIQQAWYCLLPPGDERLRGSLWDCLGEGRLPVVFHGDTKRVLPFKHAIPWSELLTVLMSEEQVTDDALNAIDTLQARHEAMGGSARAVQRLQALKGVWHLLQYSLQPRHDLVSWENIHVASLQDDAFTMTLKAVASRVMDMRHAALASTAALLQGSEGT